MTLAHLIGAKLDIFCLLHRCLIHPGLISACTMRGINVHPEGIGKLLEHRDLSRRQLVLILRVVFCSNGEQRLFVGERIRIITRLVTCGRCQWLRVPCGNRSIGVTGPNSAHRGQWGAFNTQLGLLAG